MAAPAQDVPDQIELVFWHKWTGVWKGMIDELCARYSDTHEGVVVKPLVVPGNRAKTKFMAAVVGGDPPDVMAEWDPVIPNFAASGLLYPLDKLMADTPGEREKVHAFLYPIVRKMATYDGTLYALPTSMNTFRVFYNKDVFEEVGLEKTPTTLVELQDAIDKVFKYDDRGFFLRSGFELGSWQANMIFPAFGGKFYDEENKRFICDNPQNVAALEWMCKMGDRYGVKQLRTFDLANRSELYGASDPFVSTRTGMRLFGQWATDIIERAFAEGLPSFEYDTFPMPPPPDGKPNATYVNGNFNIIPINSRHPKEAWEFMKWWTGITDPAIGAGTMVTGGWVPVGRSIVAQPAYQAWLKKNPVVGPFVEMMDSPNAWTLPSVPVQDYFARRFISTVDYAMWGLQTPREALEKMNRDMERELKRYFKDMDARKAALAKREGP
jgi:multiple sugar transport system substrate-binding protein